jgi:protein-S-isoprenylcysteine O-methyltransferase Ste14
MSTPTHVSGGACPLPCRTESQANRSTCAAASPSSRTVPAGYTFGYTLAAHHRDRSPCRSGPSVEKEKSQKIITSITSIGFVALILVPVVDHRLGWSRVPTSIVLLGDFLVALGFLVVFFAFKENTFTASTLEIMRDQEVISTGPYAIARHPMYLGGFLQLLGTPLALGSYWGFWRSRE